MFPMQAILAAPLSVLLLAIGIANPLVLGQVAETNAKALAQQQARGTLPLYLPTQITKADMSRYCAMLVLSEEQRYVVTGMFEEYERQYETATAPVASELRDLSNAESDLRGSAASAPIVEALCSRRRDLLSLVEQVDQEFFGKILSILADSQVESMYSVRSDRTRARYGGGVGMADLPEGQIDLVEILVELEVRVDGNQRLRDLIDTYLQSLNLLLGRLAKKHFECVTKDHLLMGPVLERTVTPEEGMAIMTERTRLWRPHLTLSKQLERINRLYLQLIIEALPDDSGDEVLTLYREKSYWKLYPDNSMRHELLQAAHELEDLTAEKREAVKAITDQYNLRYRRLSKDAEDAIRSRWEWMANRSMKHVEEMEAQKSRVELAIQERSAATDKAFARLREILGPDDLARLTPPEDPRDRRRRRP